MEVSFYSPVIFVNDIRVSCEFYQKMLNQEIEHDFGSNIVFKSKLSLWQPGKKHEISSIMGSDENGNTFELYFETENINEFTDRIKLNEIKLLHDLKTEPWGQMTIRFFDPDNHLIEVGESMHIFVSRIYKETGSVETTSERTGIPADQVLSLIG
jgi:catechol 2,3-dioxygenase-like lactoylglutathione lyase family enzyme